MLTLIALASETATAAAESSGGIGALGLDWRAMLFQILNFTILLLLLRLFAYQPILNILEQRRQKIDEGLRNASDAARLKEELIAEKDRILSATQTEAQSILARSREQAGNLLRAAEAQAAEKAAKTIEQAEARIAQEITAARTGLKQEILSLVADATEKIIRQKLDEKEDHKMIEETIESLPRS